MESLHLQNIRYKLQRRVRDLNGAEQEQFFYLLKQFLPFLESTPLLSGVLQDLTARVPDYMEHAGRVSPREQLYGETEEESAAIGYGVLKRYAAASDGFAIYNIVEPGALDSFRSLYLHPLYEYIDEHVDDRSYVLYALTRYKQACEWFGRKRLFDLWQADTQRGEHLLAMDLYEYLHQCGIDFHIEPFSASGEADMVSLQTGSDEPLIADVKIFNPDKSKGAPYLIKGFHQLYRYTCDYNEPVGYLIIVCVRGTAGLTRAAVGAIGFGLPRLWV